MDEYLLTIAIPTYKRADTLKRALEALIGQYDERVEVLIIDDALDADTKNVVHNASNAIPIHFIQNESNLGFDRNFIKCFRCAKGRFVLLMGDDDYLCASGLPRILNFLMLHPDIDLVFINVKESRDTDIAANIEARAKKRVIEDKICASKEEFISYAGTDLCALSNIVKRKRFEEIDNPEKYVGTSFMQTCISFEATKQNNSVLGVIGTPCIVYNTTFEDANIIKNSMGYFKIFYAGVRYVYFVIGKNCGYGEDQIREIFKHYVVELWGTVLRVNAQKVKGWRKRFWADGYPAIKDYPIAWLTIIPSVCIPGQCASLLVKYAFPIRKRVKNFIVDKRNAGYLSE